MNRLTGKYTSKRTGITYTYQAAWDLAASKLTWTATVMGEDDVAEVMAGEKMIQKNLDVATAIRRSIERRLDYRRKR